MVDAAKVKLDARWEEIVQNATNRARVVALPYIVEPWERAALFQLYGDWHPELLTKKEIDKKFNPWLSNHKNSRINHSKRCNKRKSQGLNECDKYAYNLSDQQKGELHKKEKVDVLPLRLPPCAPATVL
jgi:hypothetical protein